MEKHFLENPRIWHSHTLSLMLPVGKSAIPQRHTVLTNCQVLHYIVLLTATHNYRIQGKSEMVRVSCMNDKGSNFLPSILFCKGVPVLSEKGTDTQSCLTEQKMEIAALDKPFLVDHSPLYRVLICDKVCQPHDC